MPTAARKRASRATKVEAATIAEADSKRPEPASPDAQEAALLIGGAVKPRSAREVRSAARREAILAAALEEFSAKGFAAARLDDIARRAGVAKGTIYLYFADKEALFQDLVRAMLTPLIGQFELLAQIDEPFPTLAEKLIDVATRELVASRRKDIIRLIMAEGSRFPAIADFYYREVLSRILDALRKILTRALERGELRHPQLVLFPQLLGAPVLLAIVWNSLFEKQAPMDVHAMLTAHLDILLGRNGDRS